MDFIILNTLIAAAAEGFTDGMTEAEIGLWAAVFAQLGDSMATLLAQKALEKEEDEKKRLSNET